MKNYKTCQRKVKGKLKEDIKAAIALSAFTILPCMLMFLHWLYIGY